MHSTRSWVRAASAVVAVVLVSIACGGIQAEGPALAGNAPPPPDPPNSPTCTGITAGTAENQIGQAGGEVRFNDRNHVLAVLRDGVSSTLSIRMEQLPFNYVRVKITPSPHSFERPAVLTLSYAGCDLHGVDPGKLRIFKLNGMIWDSLPSLPNPGEKTVSALLGTLSDYAVGSN